ncbi:MAG: membrane protein FxsA [Paracoccaceae bacterium]|nr:MAG: membrane protein FxsA [Paracoccaceae bacterium]
MWLFLAFLAIPLIEIALFIELGGLLGLWPTLAIVVLTALAGTILLRREGMAALERLRRAVEFGQDPTGPVAEGAMVVLAGALLLTPGFFTDAVGLALMFAPVRRAIFAWLRPRLMSRIISVGQTADRRGPHRTAAGDPTVIDGEFEEVGPTDRPPDRPTPWSGPRPD